VAGSLTGAGLFLFGRLGGVCPMIVAARMKITLEVSLRPQTSV